MPGWRISGLDKRIGGRTGVVAGYRCDNCGDLPTSSLPCSYFNGSASYRGRILGLNLVQSKTHLSQGQPPLFGGAIRVDTVPLTSARPKLGYRKVLGTGQIGFSLACF
jgi:hypothetical protein